MTDISFDLGGYRVNLRVGATVTRGDEVLLCRERSKDWWYLPGGRIKAGESSRAALTRELSEEIGDSFRVIRPTVCAENFFDLDGLSFHEVCTFYDVEWTGGEVLQHLAGEDETEVFEWIRRQDVFDVDLKPSFIKEHIARPQPALELVIHRDGEQAHAQDVRSRAGDGPRHDRE